MLMKLMKQNRFGCYFYVFTWHRFNTYLYYLWSEREREQARARARERERERERGVLALLTSVFRVYVFVFRVEHGGFMI